MKGENRTINGDVWTIVDVAPAEPLAEMVAALLEEEGFVAMVRGGEGLDDALAHLGTPVLGAAMVLVPEEQAEAALQLIAETVTDYEGDELEAALASGELNVADDFPDEEDQEEDGETGWRA